MAVLVVHKVGHHLVLVNLGDLPGWVRQRTNTFVVVTDVALGWVLLVLGRTVWRSVWVWTGLVFVFSFAF